MGTFRVTSIWKGFVLEERGFFWDTFKLTDFMRLGWIYDLRVTPTSVELAGPGLESVRNPGSVVLTSPSRPRSFLFFSYSTPNQSAIFNGKAAGWLVTETACPAAGEQTATDGEPIEPSADGEPATTGSDEPAGHKGIVVRYKARGSSAPVVETAPSGKATVQRGNLTFEIPISAPTFSSQGASTRDVTAKYTLCPDGTGDYAVTEDERDPMDPTETVLPHLISVRFEHLN